MRFGSVFLWLLCSAAVGLSGCAGGWRPFSGDHGRPSRPETVHESAMDATPAQLEQPLDYHPLDPRQTRLAHVGPKTRGRRRAASKEDVSGQEAATIRTISHEPRRLAASPEAPEATLNIDGRTYRLQLVEDAMKDRGREVVRQAASPIPPAPVPPPLELADARLETPAAVARPPAPEPEGVRLNLPTALSMVGGQHPAVGFAQWRVQQAYAQLDQARVLWLPSIQPGFSFHRHDGNYQASDGSIIDVNRNSFQYGLGAGATGAGTTPRPGVVARFHLADAIFQPHIAEKSAWARGHAASGVINEQLLNVAVAYLQLLNAKQDLRIVEDSQKLTSNLAKLTKDFAATGQGLQADADRLQTELGLVEDRLAAAREQVEVAEAALAQALSIDPSERLVPLDPTVVPIELVSADRDKATLIQTGLSNRPELKEAQALVAVAFEQYKRQKYAPFVPSVLLGFSTGGFGGGLGNRLENTRGRYDLDALMTWEIRNLGLGEGAARRETEALIQQAKFEKVRTMDQVASQVAAAHAQAVHRRGRIAITQKAIESAENSYERNLNRIRNAQGLPLEVLQSVRALEDARRAYLRAVIEYNEAQFRLQWALGWPVFAPQDAE